MASTTGRKAPKATYPEPHTVPPASGEHKRTCIILHGRGSNGELFGSQLLLHPVRDAQFLQDIYPDAKFIFPTASKRRARAWNNSNINQWFDLWSIDEQDERVELQFDGLRESMAFVHALLEVAIAEVGARNVVLWGLSQGCAIALISLLLWTGEPFAATVGMCGWLPLRSQMEASVAASVAAPKGEHDDPFSEEGSAPNVDGLEAAVAYLREMLDPPSQAGQNVAVCRQIPVFLGHGGWDPKVKLHLGKEATSFLRSVGVSVEWREYDGLGHWYSKDMLSDIVDFLGEECTTAHE